MLVLGICALMFFQGALLVENAGTKCDVTLVPPSPMCVVYLEGGGCTYIDGRSFDGTKNLK